MHMEAMVKLDAEDAELDQAERVLVRLQEAPARVVSAQPRKGTPRKGTKRPKNIPTTREMVTTVLAEAEQSGKRGLTGKEIMLAVDDRWWPGVGWTSILPDAHRLIGKGILHKEGDLFVRSQEDETPAGGHPADASLFTDEGSPPSSSQTGER